MRTAAICPTCATYTNAVCVIYNGPNLTNINVATLDNLEDIIQNINDNLVPIYGAGAPTNGAVYEGQIYIDNSTGDIYIATSTGGGPGDWVQLALQSSIPPPQSLNDVLGVGNTSTIAINIQDLAIAPTQINTMLSDGNFLTDTTEQLSTNYHVNDIYVTDTTTGDFLQIAIDNTQNQTITFPDTSGQLALLSDTHLNLQEITDNGNLTTNVIVADSFSSTPTYLSNFASLLGYVGNGTTAHGVLSLKEDSDGTGFLSTIAADLNLTADRTISIPDEDGILMVNVTANSLTVKDSIASTTQSNTFQSIGMFVEDLTGNLTASYNVNNILVENTLSGNQLQINIDNIQNQIIDFPDTSGKLALLTDIPVAYKLYIARLTQFGTSDPIAVIVYNNFPSPIVWTRNSTGSYRGTLTGQFTQYKTVGFIQTNIYQGTIYPIQYLLSTGFDPSGNTIDLLSIFSDSTSTFTDDALNGTTIEIRVYP